MMFNDSSERGCSFSLLERLPYAGISFSIADSDLSRDLSHLVVAHRDCLAGAKPRRELELVTHALRRTVHQQMALVVVAHFEHFRRGLLAFHVSFAQLQIDNH